VQEIRSTVVDQIRRQLFGPAGGDSEVVSGKPFWRYMSGILFPRDVDVDALGESDEPDADAVGDASEQAEDPAVGLSYKELPSSMGVSFFMREASRLVCHVEGAAYEPTEENGVWQRRSLGSAASPSSAVFEPPRVGQRAWEQREVLEGRAAVSVLFRPREGGHLVTATLVNLQPAPQGGAARQTPAILFQCRFRVAIEGGSIGEYPTVKRYAKHEEDEELALVYRDRKTFGIGHGCSAQWQDPPPAEGLRELQAEPLPTVEVKGLTNEVAMPRPAAKALDLHWLARPETSLEELRVALGAFVDAYEEWTAGQLRATGTFPLDLLPAARRITGRQERAVVRMRSGIAALTDPASSDVNRAFRIAQEAMLRQFLWSARRGDPKPLGAGDTQPIDPWEARPGRAPTWRPFQLAFQLLTVESLADPDAEDRSVLDLLWFPTGGGKTEAYLALTAFEIALRRLRYQEAGGGTAVIMRYTLRLLTSQQFERCATLISVLETMRRQQPELGLGQDPISLGLWVGGETTPNRLDADSKRSPGAMQVLDRVLNATKPENPFQLLACPHCGTRLVPENGAPRAHYGFDVSASEFKAFCPDGSCILHEGIPISVVDEDLYLRPPSLLIGTIDKFARMVWEPRSRSFFGLGASDVLPPSLIVQDELHLITGPLGTIAGVYEAAIDTILAEKGIRAKYLAATATIQRAAEQCKALYARDAFVFPPSGIDASDSFFSRENRNSPGRLFVGVMGPGLYSALTSLIQVSAAAADAVCEIPQELDAADGSRARDAYWTQVIYHNSRQELGKTTTMLRDDVLTRLHIIQPVEDRRRKFDKVEELSANLKGNEVSEALEHLQVEWPSANVIDALACTNMISVGIDVARLGLMIVKGQPKSTAEYIQATSRVGRSSRRPPGIVVALYTSFRPRDRSHYETFQAFHQALYRAVEPTSVTPFAPPALDRTLHAGLVVALRHCLGWDRPGDARRFDREAAAAVLEALAARLEAAAKAGEIALLRTMIEERLEEWESQVQEADPRPLVFNGGRQFRALLRPFEHRDPELGLWATLNSMRHVDGETRFEVWRNQ
jgi:hypothetical protein